MGIEHERIHLETSSVLFRQLPIEHVKPHSLWRPCPTRRTDRASVPKNELLPVPSGNVSLGKPFDADIYGWDNEYGVHDAQVAGQSRLAPQIVLISLVDQTCFPSSHIYPHTAFSASKFLVTNAEFADFIDDGGYDNERWWGAEGWRFVTYKQARHPVFWVPVLQDNITGGEQQQILTYRYRSMTDVIDMPWDWPVDCNYFEAKAFCNWLSSKSGRHIRLPTEDEWTRFRDFAYPQSDANQRQDQPFWTTAPGNINLEQSASSTPIDMNQFSHGFFDVIGNVWQWTETPIYAFQGFKFHPLCA